MSSMEEKPPADQVGECLYYLLDEAEVQEQQVEQQTETDEDEHDDGISFPSSSLLTSNTFIPTPPKEFSRSKISSVHSTKQVELSIPETKSNAVLSTPFSCDATCTHYSTYHLQIRQESYRQFDLDKLDVVLNPTGVLDVQCILLLNNLKDKLDYPSWLQVVLDKVMQKCRFKPKPTTTWASAAESGTYYYQIEKAFVTTPISYVLDKQAPYGTLDKLEVVFNFTSPKLKEFQANWKRKLTLDIMSNYLEEALTTLLIKKTCHLYPLIFSSTYAKKLTQNLSYLPHIAQSLQKIYITSRSTMSITNHAFSESIEQKLDTIKRNVEIMAPYKNDQEDTTAANADVTKDRLQELARNDTITDYLTLGMYYSLRNDNKLPKTTKNGPTFDPPNALCSIARLWSITCSTSYNDDSLM
ncbi:hypothetical protein [Parasitella parasitica]|uniref:Uncharacterized protein n=1 Tax=Parasitella parasitica TaxID=35722 RepID=A0A0B7NAN1_9FUNG|nr:hypothetical protein [Parasitella parasitica]